MQLYTTGPAALFVGTGVGNTPEFLCYGETAPTATVNRPRRRITTDLSCGAPMDAAYGPQHGSVSVLAAVMKYSVMRKVQDVFSGRSANPAPGKTPPGSAGALAVTEGLTMFLWMTFPAAMRPAYQRAVDGALPGGYLFAAAIPTDDRIRPGYGPLGVGLNFDCYPVLSPLVISQTGVGEWDCFRELTLAELLNLPVPF